MYAARFEWLAISPTDANRGSRVIIRYTLVSKHIAAPRRAVSALKGVTGRHREVQKRDKLSIRALHFEWVGLNRAKPGQSIRG